MSGWQIAIVVVGAAAGILAGLLCKPRVLAAVVLLVGDSWVRALVLLVVALVVGVPVGVVSAQLLPRWYEVAPVATVLLAGVYLGVVSFLVMPFFPDAHVAPTARSWLQERREHGAGRAIPRVLGWGGAVVSLVLFAAMVLAPALFLIDPWGG